MRITSDPNHPFSRLPDELAQQLSEAFEPLLENDDSQRSLNALADAIEREAEYRYDLGLKRGRKVALEFIGNRFGEVADKVPEGFGWFGWCKAFLVAGYGCCMRDERLSSPDAFWAEVRAAYNRAEKADAAIS